VIVGLQVRATDPDVDRNSQIRYSLMGQQQQQQQQQQQLLLLLLLLLQSDGAVR